MESEALREQTASERLSREQEEEMQSENQASLSRSIPEAD